jgi:hypothetical protein
MTALAKRTKIGKSTLSTWKHNLLSDPTWRPKREHYGEAHQIFTREQEIELSTRIATNYIDKGLFYSDTEFKIDALRFHKEIVCRSEGIMPGMALSDRQMEQINKFKASWHFIQAFRHRNRLSLRRPSFKRRPKPTEADMQAFIAQVQSCLQNYRRDRIINIDETNWKTVAGGFMTWAHTNAESVQCQIDNDEKEGVTVIAAVDAEGGKLPLTVIGKGKTERCLKGYQLPPEVRTCVSESGWTTKDVMCRYFAILRQELYPEGPLIVILDAYAAHRSREVREIARLWEIQLVFIPPGCTDKLQPLDRRVFGVLKSYARQLWRKQHHESGGAKTTRPMMAANLCEAWRRITEGLIQDAWGIYDQEDWESLIAEEKRLHDEMFGRTDGVH